MDGDEGTVHSYLQATYGWFSTSYWVVGRYDDKYQRTANGWRLTEMTIESDYTVPTGVGWTGNTLHYLDPKNVMKD